MKKKSKKIEFELPFDTIRNLIVAHLYAVSYLNDNAEVEEFEFVRGVDKFNKILFKMKVTND